MKPDYPVAAPQAAASARTGQGAGAIVRSARLAAGLTLADLGRRCGYSASQISRYERGVQPLTDITLLRRLADTLAIHPQSFGLAPHDGGPAGRHALTGRKERPASPGDPRVGREFPQEDGEDPVRRRELLAGAAGLAGAAALGRPGALRNQTPADPASSLADLLYGAPAAAEPMPVPALRAATASARADFQAARYDRITAGLPRLVGAATA
ncbi:MAG: helix-turn-helix domain-containing protein, partial [Streptosporangiaceae bacterium]